MNPENPKKLEDSLEVFDAEVREEVQVFLPTPLKKTRKRKANKEKLRRSPRLLNQPPEFSGLPVNREPKMAKLENQVKEKFQCRLWWKKIEKV